MNNIEKLRELENERDLITVSINLLKEKLEKKEISLADYQSVYAIKQIPNLEHKKLSNLNKQISEMKESLKTKPQTNKLYAIAAFIIVGLVILAVLFGQSNITGLFTYERLSYQDMIVDQSFVNDKIIEFNITNLVSLKVTGYLTYTEESDFEILLLTDQGKLVVLDKDMLLIPKLKETSRGNLITGLIADEINETVDVTKVTEEVNITNQTEDLINITEEVSILLNLTNNLTDEIIENITLNITDNLTQNLSLNLSNATINITDLNITNESVNITLNITEINETINISEINITVNETLNLTVNITSNATVNITELNITNETINLTINITEINETINQTINLTIKIKDIKGLCKETCNLNELSAESIIIRVENAELYIEKFIYAQKTENAPPVQIKDFVNATAELNKTYKYNLSDYFVDKDWDELTYDYKEIESFNIDLKQDEIFFTPQESGEFTFYVYAFDGEALVQSNIFTIVVIPKNITNETIKFIESLEQKKAIILEPVKWKKTIDIKKPEKLKDDLIEISTTIPENILNLTIIAITNETNVSIDPEFDNKIDLNKIKELVKLKDSFETISNTTDDKRIKSDIKQRILSIDSKLDTIDQETIDEQEYDKGELELLFDVSKDTEKVLIEYETEAPKIFEQVITSTKKIITISSDIHYKNITAKSYIDDKYNSWNINLYHYEDNMRVPVAKELIEFIDANNNGFVDYIQWLVPHLSNQTYEIEIVVLNPYTYLKDGETWYVRFNTTGVGNLTISSPNSFWKEILMDDNETIDEMKFLDISCGGENLVSDLKIIDEEENVYDYVDILESDSIKPEKFLIEDYSCNNATGEFVNLVNIAGYATLEFNFSNQYGSVTDYAYDPCNPPGAGDWDVDGVEVCEDMTITLPAGIDFETGESLTLKNVTLTINGNIDTVAGSNFTVYDNSIINAASSTDRNIYSYGIVNITDSNTTADVIVHTVYGITYLDNVDVGYLTYIADDLSRVNFKDTYINSGYFWIESGTNIQLNNFYEDVALNMNITSTTNNFCVNLTNTEFNAGIWSNNGGTLNITDSNFYQLLHYNYDNDDTYLTNSKITIMFFYNYDSGDDLILNDLNQPLVNYNRNITGVDGDNVFSFTNSNLTYFSLFTNNADVNVTNSTLYHFYTIANSNNYLINSTVSYLARFYSNSITTIQNSILDSAAYSQFYDTAVVNFTQPFSRVDDFYLYGGATESNIIHGYLNITSLNAANAWTAGHILNRYFPFNVSDSGGDPVSNANVIIKNTTGSTINSGTTNANGIVNLNITDNANNSYQIYIDSDWKANITMLECTAPAGIQLTVDGIRVASATLTPSDADTSDDLIGNVTCSDPEDGSLTVYWKVFNNSVEVISEAGIDNVTKDINKNVKNISSSLTTLSDEWNIEFTCSNGTLNSTPLNTSVVTIQNSVPSISSVILNSTSGNNLTGDNLTVYVSGVTDLDGDAVTNITDWRKDGVSIAVLNMPFDTNRTGETGAVIMDYSTYSNNGTLDDTPTWNSSCQVGGCYMFDSSQDHIEITNDDSLNIGAEESVTVMAWVMILDNNTDNSIYYDNGGSSALHGIWMWFSDSTQDYNFRIQDSDTDHDVTVDYTAPDIDFINSWHHFTGVYDRANNNISFYVDGVLKESASVTADFGEMNNTLDKYIGSLSYDSVYDMNGSIDEVKLFNISLSPEQVYQEFLAGNNSHNLQTIVSQETSANQNWSVAVTPNDGYVDGDSVTASLLLSGGIPSVGSVVLNSSSGNNLTGDNLTVYVSGVTDLDGDAVTNITDWRKEGVSIAVLNLPFDIDRTDEVGAVIRDYSTFENNATPSGSPVWNSSCQVGGCYVFDGINDEFTLAAGSDLDFNFTNTNDFSISIWVNKYSNGTSGNTFGLIGKAVKYGIDYVFSSNILRAGIRNAIDGPYYAQFNPDNNISGWNHVVMVYKSETSDGLRIYYNGEHKDNATTVGLSDFGSASSLFLGGDISTGGTPVFFNGSIDEVIIVNHSLSGEQIVGLYNSGIANHSLETIVSQETSVGENWSVAVTPNDGVVDGDSVTSSVLNVVNSIPSISSIILNSSFGNNLTTDNLTVYVSGVTDLDGDAVTNITDWRKDGVSIAVLNMPFDTNDDSVAKDYSTYDNNGTIAGATWTSSGKVGGAYSFDGDGDYIELNSPITLESVSLWANFNPVTSTRYFLGGTSKGVRYDGNNFLIYNGGSGWTTVAWTKQDKLVNFVVIRVNTTYYDIYIDGDKIGTGYAGNLGDIPISFLGRRSDGYYFNSLIDEIKFYNYTLSPEQINVSYLAGLANHSLETIVSQETSVGDNWSVAVTPNDAIEDGTTVFSENLTIIDACDLTENITLTRDLSCTNVNLASGIILDTATYSINTTGTATINGTLNASQGGNHGFGSLTINPGGVYHIASGTTTITNDFNQNGTLIATGGTVDISGNSYYRASTDVENVNFDVSDTFIYANFDLNGGDYNISSDLNVSNQTIYNNTDVFVNGNLNVLENGSLILINSTINVTGDAVIYTDGNYTGGSLSNILGALTINSNGTYNATSDETVLYGNWTLQTDATFTHSSGTLRISDNSTVSGCNLHTSNCGSLYKMIIDDGSTWNKGTLTTMITNKLTQNGLIAGSSGTFYLYSSTLGNGDSDSNNWWEIGVNGGFTEASTVIITPEKSAGTYYLPNLPESKNAYTLSINNGGSRTLKVPSNGELYLENVLYVGTSGTDTYTHLLDTNAGNLTVGGTVNLGENPGMTGIILGRNGTHSFGALTINANGTYNATNETTTLDGHFTNDGTFNHNLGTVSVVGSTDWNVNINKPRTVFYNLDAGTGGSYMDTGNITVLNELSKSGSKTIRLYDDLYMGNSTYGGNISADGWYFNSNSGIYGQSNTSHTHISKDPAYYGNNNIILSNVEFHDDITTGTNNYGMTVIGDSEFQSITLSTDNDTLNITGSVNVSFDALTLNGTLIAGSGRLTNNTGGYWLADFDNSQSYTFSSTSISYGNNTGSDVIDARNGVDGGNNIPAGMWKFGGTENITLDSPLDNWYVNDTLIFECSATLDVSLVNISLFHNYSGSWVRNATNSVGGLSNSTSFTVNGLSTEKTFDWYCEACDAFGCYASNTNRSVIVDLTKPAISFQGQTPIDNARNSTSNNFAFVNVSVSDASNNVSAFIDWNNSLVGWWGLEQGNGTFFADSSSYGNNGTCTGATCPNVTIGMRGKAYKFDGVDDYVEVNYEDSINLTNDLSIGVWIKTINSDCVQNYGIVTRGTDVAFHITTNDVLRVYASNSSGGAQAVLGTTDVCDGNWHHVAVTYNLSNWILYLDGNKEATNNGITGALSGLNQPTRIGWYSGGGAYYFNGTIDEVQIFSRALSAEEINASYNAGLHKLTNNFTGLSSGSYTYTSYAVDQAGNKNETEQRTFKVNYVPSSPTLILNSTSGTNYTTEDLTVYISSGSDADDDAITNITDWRKDGTSIAVLNMPFDTNIGSNSTGAVKDYSTYENNGTLGGGNVSRVPTWNSSGKVGGAYSFDGIDDNIKLTSAVSLVNKSVALWIKNNTGWYHLVNVSGTTYVNGVVMSVSIPFNSTAIGVYIDTTYFNGSIDEVQIYNHSLTPEQINASYQAGLANHSVQKIVSNETTNEVWSVAVTPNDGYEDGTTVLSNNLTTRGHVTSTDIKCYNGSDWLDCDNIEFAQTIYMQANCSSNMNVSANFVLENIEDSSVLDNQTITTESGGIYNTSSSVYINDSGNFTITVTCNTSVYSSQANDTFDIAWGTLVPYVVDPSGSNKYVYFNTTFLITTGINCTGGECGNITAWVDPACPGYDDDTYCWIEGAIGDTCEDACGSEGSTCIVDNWNDDESCTILQALGNDCGTCEEADKGQNYWPGSQDEGDTCRYRFSTDSQDCSDGERDTARACACNLSDFLSAKTGIIPEDAGSPFYVNSSILANPVNYSSLACLVNMKAGDSCNQTWNITVNTSSSGIHDFFSGYNATQYPTQVANVSTTHWNVTVKGKPTLSYTVPNQLWYNSVNNTALNLSLFFTDADGDNLNYSVAGNNNFTISIDDSTGIVTIKPTAGASVTNTINFTAIDPQSNTITSNNIVLNTTSTICTKPSSGLIVATGSTTRQIPWNITQACSVSNQVINMDLDQDVYVNHGLVVDGDLIFNNVTLLFNSSADGESTLKSYSGLDLNITNSNITSSTTSYEYKFIIESNSDFDLTNSYVSEAGYGSTASTRGLEVSANNSVINNNTFTNCYIGISIDSSDNNISNNTINMPAVAFYGIYLVSSSAQSNNILDNTITTQGSSDYGIYSSDSDSNVISNNNISTSESSGYGIYLNSNADSNNVSNNVISTSGSNAYGIRLATCNYNNISNNNISTIGSLAHSIAIGASDSNNVSNNKLVGSSSNAYGLYIFSGADSNYIFNNNISSDRGIWLASSDSNNIFDNEISTIPASDGRGMYIFDSDFNIIYNNNILTNGSSAYGAYLYSSTANLFYNSTINATNANDIYIRGTGTNNLTNITFDTDDVGFYDASTTGGINILYYVDVNSTSSLGMLADVSVSAYDKNAVLRDSGTSDGASLLRLALLSKFMNRTINTTYSNYSINGTKSNYFPDSESVNVTGNLISSNAITLLLSPIISGCRDLNETNTIYYLNESLTASGTCFNVVANNVTLDCQSYTINYSVSGLGYGVNSSYYNLTTVKNCNIDRKGSTNYAYGIYLYYSHNATILNNNITSVNDGSYSFPLRADYSDYLNLTDNYLHPGSGSSRACFYFYYADFANIYNNTFYNPSNGWGSHGIQILHSNGSTWRYNNITTSEVAPIALTATTSAYSIHDIDTTNEVDELPILFNYSLSNYAFEDLDYSSTYGLVACVGCDNVTYDNVTIGGDLFLFSGSDNISLINSNLSTTSGYAFVQYSDDFNISNVELYSEGHEGIYFGSGSDGLSISNSKFTGAGSGPMLYVVGPDYVVIRNITINKSSGSCGLYLSGSDYCNVTDSTFQSAYAVATSGQGNTIKDSEMISDSSDVYIIQNTYATNFTNCTFDKSDVVFYAGRTGGLNILYYSNVNVSDAQGNMLSDASVSAYDKNTVLRDSGTTDGVNLLVLTLLSEYMNKTINITYSNYTINATKSLYTEDSESINISGNVLVNLTLQSSNLSVALDSPLSGWFVNDTSIFECNYSASIDLNNVSLYLNNSGWSANQTSAISGTSGESVFNVSGFGVGDYLWNCKVCNDDSYCEFASSNNSFSVDLTKPAISFQGQTPADNARNSTSNNFAFVNVSVSDASNNVSAFIDWNNSLVGWWGLEQGNGTFFADSSSYGNNGTCTGATCPNVTIGMRGKAYKFDGYNGTAGTGDRITIPNHASLEPDSEITISAWFYANAFAGDSLSGNCILTKGTGSTGYWLVVGEKKSHFKWGKYDVHDADSDVFNPTINTWHHIAVTFNSSYTTFYYDGNNVGGRAMTKGSGNSNDVTLGYYSNPSPNPWNGSIDEVQIFSRALSPEEINASYNAGLHKLTNNFTGLSSGSYAYTSYTVDQAGNKNETEERTFKVNYVPTTPSLLAPINNYNSTEDNVTFNFSSTDSDGDTITYYLYINSLYNDSTTDENITVTFADGNYNWSVKAGDNYDNSSMSAVRLFYVNYVTDYYVATTGNDSTGDGSSGSPWKTIQFAIDNVQSGDTIHVENGTYTENVDVNKTVNLIGDGYQNTTVSAASSGDHVFDVSVNNVNISGFTVTGATNSGKGGIYLNNANNSNIFNNNASNNNYGIYLSYSFTNSLINNTANANNGRGIYIAYSSSNNLTNNTANSNSIGIRLYSSSLNILRDNIANSNSDEGIFLFASSNNSLIDNTINFNSLYGVVLSGSSSNNLTNNKINLSKDGIYLVSSSANNILINNTLGLNFRGIYLASDSSSNILTNNTAKANNYGIYLSSSSNTLTSNRILRSNFAIFDSETNNYTSNKFLNNLNNTMFRFEEVSREVADSVTINFSIPMFNANGSLCNTCDYNITISPSENININQEDNELIGNFTPNRIGIYSLIVNVTDENNNTARKKLLFFIGNATNETAKYYLRDIDPTHGQPTNPGQHNDAASLLFTSPSEEEWWTCGGWIQNSPNELPEHLLNVLKRVDFYVWYNTTAEGNLGIQRYTDYTPSVDEQQSVDASINQTWVNKNITTLNWSMDYAWSWYWLSLKLVGTNPHWYTNATQPSYVNFTYLYTTTPEIKSINNTDIQILSATSPATNTKYAEIILDGEGSTNLIVQMLNTTISNYTVLFDGVNCDNANCTYVQSNGELNFSLVLGSEHNLSIKGNSIPVMVSSRISPVPAYTNNNLLGYCYATDIDADSITYYYRWYNGTDLFSSGSSSGYTQGLESNVNNLSSSNTAEGENWTFSCLAYDGYENSSTWSNSSVTIGNSPPNTPTLLSPTDDNNTLFNRSPNFIWNCTDNDSDTLNFTLEINITAGDTNKYYTELNITPSGNNYTYTIPDELKTYIETSNNVYEWRVRAYDGTNYSAWSDTYNFSIEESVIISMVNNNVDFGSDLMLLTEYDTISDANPFQIRNDGNVNVTLINLTTPSFWLSQPLGTEYLQYKTDNYSTNSTYNYSGSTTSWTNFSSNNANVTRNLYYEVGSNYIETDLKILVPGAEPPGNRSATFNFYWEIDDGYS